jgi:hypothetical protein
VAAVTYYLLWHLGVSTADGEGMSPALDLPFWRPPDIDWQTYRAHPRLIWLYYIPLLFWAILYGALAALVFPSIRPGSGWRVLVQWAVVLLTIPLLNDLLGTFDLPGLVGFRWFNYSDIKWDMLIWANFHGPLALLTAAAHRSLFFKKQLAACL